MATHKIGNFKFNLSKRGFAYRVGEGEIHRIPFGKQEKDNEYDESNPAYEDAGADGALNGAADDEEEYGPDREYDDQYYDDRAEAEQDGEYDDQYADDQYAGGEEYADSEEEYPEDGYEDGEEENVSPLMQYVEEHDWVTLALLVLLPPLGIYLLWRRHAFETVLRYALTALSAIWCLVLLILIFTALFGGNRDTSTTQGATVVTTTAPTLSATVAVTPEITSGADFVFDDAADGGATPAPTPLTGAASGDTGADATSSTGADTTGSGATTSVFSPASGLYYHTNRECERIPTGVSVSTVTVAVAESRNQSRCPTCYGLDVYYATAGGKYYHSDPTCTNMRNAVEYTLEAAQKSSKTACPTCIGGGAAVANTATAKTSTATNSVQKIAQSVGVDQSGISVYCTQGGTYFHTRANCSNMQDAKQVSLLLALQMGKAACPTCAATAGTGVYCTTGGTSYHLVSDCKGMQNAMHIPLALALSMGKTSCTTCGSSRIGQAATSTNTSTNTGAGTGNQGVLTDKNGTVYVYGTQTGKYYHSDATCDGMTDATRVPLKYMLNIGRPACPICCKGASTTVYAAEGGTYFHSYATCSNMTGATKGTLAQALAAGYKSCPNCWGAAAGTNTGATGVMNNSGDKSGIAVYATQTGQFFHTNATCSGMQNATKMSLGDALKYGKTACSTCASGAARVVYATEGGKYYHYNNTCSGMTNAKAGRLAQALVSGFTACPVCVTNAQAAPAPTTTAAVTNSGKYTAGTSGIKVYATQSGKYYHTSKTHAGTGATYVTLETAMNYGKTPCPTCCSYASRTVYATANGKYFHANLSCAGEGATAGTLAKALAMGYKACPDCINSTQQTPTTVPVNSGTYTSGRSGIKVYSTLAEKYYHTSKSHAGAGATQVTLETALNYGKSACPTCSAFANNTIYATSGKPYYHRLKACAGSGATEGTLAKALAVGLKQCPVCFATTPSTSPVVPVATPKPGTASGDSAVYVNLDSVGSFYHSGSACTPGGLAGGTKVTLAYAIEWGYTACPYCGPATSAT